MYKGSKHCLNERGAIIITVLFDDGKYLLISEIYGTRQVRLRGLFDHFTIDLFIFILFHLFYFIYFLYIDGEISTTFIIDFLFVRTSLKK